jgi:hypothetical protein
MDYLREPLRVAYPSAAIQLKAATNSENHCTTYWSAPAHRTPGPGFERARNYGSPEDDAYISCSANLPLANVATSQTGFKEERGGDSPFHVLYPRFVLLCLSFISKSYVLQCRDDRHRPNDPTPCDSRPNQITSQERAR